MIWAGMLVCHSGKAELVIVNGCLNACQYCDEIINPVVIPVLQRGRADFLKQNNACFHVVHHTMFSPFTAEQHLDTRLAFACDKNFNSLRRQCAEVVKQKGGHTGH